MDTIAHALTADQRDQILTAVHAAVRSSHSPGEADARPVEGAETIDTHLDALVNIVRRSTAQTIEPYLAQILEDVCCRCRHQSVSGYCPQRAAGPCVVFRFVAPIVRAIQGALHEMGDEEYLANRG